MVLYEKKKKGNWGGRKMIPGWKSDLGGAKLPRVGVKTVLGGQNSPAVE